MSKFVDFSEGKAWIVKNGDWLKKMNYIEFLRDVGVHFSVNKMLTAECFKSRMEKGLSFLAVSYTHLGLKLKQVAKNRQIFSVTQLAQIAALADHHFLVQKNNDGERTFTSVKKLTREERIEEVARIMGTGQATEITLKNAEEMIARGNIS